MKKILKRIIPHIIPEIILFFTRILPLGLFIALSLFSLKAYYHFQSPLKTILTGTLTCIGGIYLMRITAYAVKSTIIKIKNVIPDIYYDESLNDKA
jgi:hypothetical protein